MSSTYSPLKVELQATGENSTTWGDITNDNLEALEEAITGSADVTFASANVTISLTDTNASQTARNLRLRCIGTSGGARNLVVPTIEKLYLVKNECADAITVKTSAGTGIAVPAGKSMWVFADGTNVVDGVTHLSSLTTTSTASVGTNLTVAGNASITGTLGVTGATTLTTLTVSSTADFAQITADAVAISNETGLELAYDKGLAVGPAMLFRNAARNVTYGYVRYTSDDLYVANEVNTGDVIFATVNGHIKLLGLSNYANDAAAAIGGVPVAGLYRNGSVVMVRVS